MLKKSISLLLCIILCFTAIPAVFATSAAEVRNLIYMIPDGGGMAPFMLADAVKSAGGFSAELYPNATKITNDSMYLRDYFVGVETTHSANNEVTDSAAAGTALATGHKTNNGMIGMTPDFVPRASLLEASQEQGKNTGLVATFEWTNATPATFSAHADARTDAETIAKQMLCQDLDVVLTATLEEYDTYTWYNDKAYTDKGYTLIKTLEDLRAVKPGDKIWSRLPDSYYDIEKSEMAPTLAELTETALRALDNGNENGFFLMVEGSTVDLACHNNNPTAAASEFVAFDEAFKVALDFAKSRKDTAIIVMPDHDTGGLIFDPADTPDFINAVLAGSFSNKLKWETVSHTGRNGGIFMYLPEGVALPEGISDSEKETAFSQIVAKEKAMNTIDNTDIPKYAAGLIGVDLDATSKALFQDVTDMGRYNETTGVFTFNSGILDFEVTATRDSDLVTMDGKTVSLEGRPCIYAGGKFYVPEQLFKIGKEYTVSFETEGGNAVAPVNAKWGETVKKPADPVKKGFVFTGWFTDKEGKVAFDFSAPIEGDLTVFAKWTSVFAFTDVTENDWFYDNVRKIYEKGLMNGVTATTFAPTADLTRAMFVTILYRMEKEPAAPESMEFTDISENAYYKKPVLWAKANGIVSGISETLFAPEAPLTREQMVAIIHRYAGFKGLDTGALGEGLAYTDLADISDYAKEAVLWAGDRGIVRGNADGSFAPKNVAKRAETATIFVRIQNLFQ